MSSYGSSEPDIEDEWKVEVPAVSVMDLVSQEFLVLPESDEQELLRERAIEEFHGNSSTFHMIFIEDRSYCYDESKIPDGLLIYNPQILHFDQTVIIIFLSSQSLRRVASRSRVRTRTLRQREQLLKR